jgi:hypothetical protein
MIKAYLPDGIVVEGNILSSSKDERGFLRWKVSYFNATGEEIQTESSHLETKDGKVLCAGCGNENAGLIVTEKEKIGLCRDCQEKVKVCEDCGHKVLSFRTAEEKVVCRKCLGENYACCDNCGEYIHSDNAYSTARNGSVCQNCYENHYFTCQRCDELYHNDDSRGDGYCVNCYEEDEEDKFYLDPGEIRVTDKTKEKLRALLKKPLPVSLPGCCRGNEGDPYIAQIIRAVGEVDLPVYLYGLLDRKEHQISLPAVLLQKFQKSEWRRAFKTIGNSSLNKIGICLDLRKNQFNRVVRLIKYLTRR